MSPDDGLDEELSELLAADQALAAGASADTPLEAGLQRDLDFLRRLRRALNPSIPASLPVSGGVADGTLSAVGRFQVRRELGRGTFGVVFLAHDPLLDREVALKVPRAEILVTPELRERFQREARAAAGLDHPHLVPVYEAGEAGPICFLVSAYCPGPTLAQWLRQRTEPVPFDAAARLVATLAEAVEYAHRRGVVHRDLKPSNILLSVASGGDTPSANNGPRTPDDGLTPKITDFGLAKLLDGAPGSAPSGYPTRSGAVVGTAGYMAPEQAGGKARDVGPAADTYALGVILYEVLTGRPPFRGETELDTLHQVRTQEPVAPTRLRPKVPRDLETICLKCLQKEPHGRYESAAALAEDLHRYLAGKPISARRMNPAERWWRWCRRNPAVASLLGSLILVLTAGAVVSTLYRLHANAKSEEAKREARAARLHEYGENMLLTQAAWEQHQVGRFLQLLEEQKPREGEEDLRGFEWYYWRTHSSAVTLPSRGTRKVSRAWPGASTASTWSRGVMTRR
jgi:serine/threonine protein kinase